MAEKSDENFDDAPEDEEFLKLSAEDIVNAKEIQDTVNQAMAVHFTKLESEVNNLFNERMATIETNLTSRLSEKVTIAQEDVLKTNKVFREISRPLGSNWIQLFRLLTAGIPEVKVEEEISNIKKQVLLMQPYKSLMAWKELKGSSFNIADLIPSLKSLSLNDLADIVERILYRDTKDDLFNLTSLAKEVEPPKNKQTNKVSSTPKDKNNLIATEGLKKDVSSTQPTQIPLECDNSAIKGSLDDRHLLLVARGLGSNWKELAVKLGVDDDDISELMSSDDPNGYQSAFRMLWNWRESKNGVIGADETLRVLVSALNELHLSNLISCLS